MMIHDITVLVGKHKKKKRIGRGIGSGHGKTSGRGHKGAGSRSGWGGSIAPGYEGGQMPLFRRIPKRGFSNARFKKVFAVVNLRSIEARFENGAQVNPETLKKAGLIPSVLTPVKILGEGDLTKKFNVTAAAFSQAAGDKIAKAGGAIQIVQPARRAAAPAVDAS